MTLSPLKISLLPLSALQKILNICHFYPTLHWNETKLRNTLDMPHSLALGIMHEDVLLAFVLFAQVMDEAELLLLAVHPDYAGQGYALKLLEAAFLELKQKQVQRIFLEVRMSNMRAIKLYQDCGFTLIHTRKDYYASKHGVKEDALIMELCLR